VKLKRRYTWILLSQNAQVAAVDDKTLTIALVNQGARSSFMSGGSEEILRQAAIDVIGHDWRIEAIVDPSAQPGTGIESSGPRTTYSPNQPSESTQEEQPPAEPEAAPAAPPAAPEPQRRPVDPAAVATARGAIQETRPKGEGRSPQGPVVSDDDASPDDPDADDDLAGTELLQRELGAHVIEEIKHD
jgi:DNA polymerase-3 subunit gamma/tau